jgi:hypothetical protein
MGLGVGLENELNLSTGLSQGKRRFGPTYRVVG